MIIRSVWFSRESGASQSSNIFHIFDLGRVRARVGLEPNPLQQIGLPDSFGRCMRESRGVVCFQKLQEFSIHVFMPFNCCTSTLEVERRKGAKVGTGRFVYMMDTI